MRLRAFMSAVALAAASTVQGLPSNPNVISKVEVQDSGTSLVISIQGSKPPNFTTFSMMDPPRFVIDFSESRFKDVPEELPVGSGVVKVIKNLSYGSDASAIARVMITFEQEVEPPDVQASGGTLLVKVMKPAGAAVASAAPADERKGNGAGAAPAGAPVAAAATPSTGAKSGAEQGDKPQADSEAQSRADREAKAKEQARADAAAKAKAEEQARADAAAKAKAEEQAQADAAAKAKAEEQARADAAAKAKAEEQAQADAAAKAKAEEQARADAAAKAKAEEQAQADAAAKAKTEEQPRTAEGAANAQAATPAPAPVAVAPVETGAGTERAGSEPRSSMSPSQVREVGFKLLPDFSRVFVRTNGRPEFTIQESGENVVRLELANTRVTRRNDTRFLDTSYFPSAVAMVTPKRQGSNYVLEIRLKQRVAYQQKLDGDMLAIDFERPASMRSAPAVESTSPASAPPGAMLPANGAEPSEEAASPGAAGN